jgi:hypothetical protein
MHDLERLKREVFVIPIKDARSEAIRHLSDTRKFRCVAGRSESISFNSDIVLPSLVVQFFTRYDHVEETMGDVRLSRSLIGPSLIDTRFTRIGTGGEHSEIVVQPGSEDVYTMDGLESATSDGSLDWYPTIYHFIVMSVRILHPDSATGTRT